MLIMALQPKRKAGNRSTALMSVKEAGYVRNAQKRKGKTLAKVRERMRVLELRI